MWAWRRLAALRILSPVAPRRENRQAGAMEGLVTMRMVGWVHSSLGPAELLDRWRDVRWQGGRALLNRRMCLCYDVLRCARILWHEQPQSTCGSWMLDGDVLEDRVGDCVSGVAARPLAFPGMLFFSFRHIL